MRGLLGGITRLAAGRAGGWALVPASHGYLLLGLAVLALVYAVPVLRLPWPQGGPAGGPAMAISHAALSYVATILAPLLIIRLLAGRGDVAGQWRRFAVAFVWLWVLIDVVLDLLPDLLGLSAGLGRRAAGAAAVTLGLAAFHFTVIGYLIWLHWFLIRRGLGVSALRAAIVVVVLIVAVSSLDTARYQLIGPNLTVTIFTN